MEHNHADDQPCTSRCPEFEGPDGLDYRAILAERSSYMCTLCGATVARTAIDIHTDWHRGI